MRPVIIIFGAAVRPDGSASGAMRSRVAAAIETGRALDDPLYMPTGGQGRYGRAESAVMTDLLVAGGVARGAIRPEPTAVNTFRSVLACRALLGRRRATVYVATSGYHMARCVVLLRLAGLRARPGRVPKVPASGDRLKRWGWRLREVPALPVDASLMVLQRLRDVVGRGLLRCRPYRANRDRG